MDDRYGRVKWGAGEARIRTKTWDQPRAWNRKAAASGEPWRVFCGSLCDVFDNDVCPEWRVDLFRLIEETPALTWMLLTKRIGNVPTMVEVAAPYHRLAPNVWLGITVVNQEEADRDIPKLLAVPAAVRWLSCEPLLGWLNLTDYLVDCYVSPRVDWVIVGGESGRDARPMDADWVRMIRNDCSIHGVPFHFKQWGEWAPYDRGAVNSSALATPGSLDRPMQRFGKKMAGHLLDGVEHRAFPPMP
jgi:protein gp37